MKFNSKVNSAFMQVIYICLILLFYSAHSLAISCPKAIDSSQITTPSGSESKALYNKLIATLNSEKTFPQRATPAPKVRTSLIDLGRLLAFDKVLSGNRDISCMTCHHPHTFTGDERLLGFGTGAGNKNSEQCNGETNIGTDRFGKPDTIISRHTPALYNLHLYKSFFWDSRVEPFDLNNDKRSESIRTPAGNMIAKSELPYGQISSEFDLFLDNFEFGALSAMPLFPLIDRKEMRGKLNSDDNQHEKLNSSVDNYESGNCASWDYNYNEFADDIIEDSNNELILSSTMTLWQKVIYRLQCEAPDYLPLFKTAYENITDWNDVSPAHISNAIAGYMIAEFESVESRWDSFLKYIELNDEKAARKSLNPSQMVGAEIFFRKGCDECHSGPVFSDFKHHNTGLRQVGPGKVNHGKEKIITGVNSVNSIWDDWGRWGVTKLESDKYAFRTQPLLNVSETWTRGHSGQFLRLDDFINHYRIPEKSYTKYERCFDNYNFAASNSPIYDMFYDEGNETDPVIVNISEKVTSMRLNTEDIFYLDKFLRSLTDETICNQYPQPGKLYKNQLLDQVKSYLDIDYHPVKGCVASPNTQCQNNN